MLPRWLRAAIALSPLLGVSCAAVLDIEKAELDESIGGSGGPCDEYCDSVMANCTEVRDENDDIVADHRQYDSRATCLGVCSKFPAGTVGDRNGLSVACRRHFADLAATSEPEAHCPIAGPSGQGICGNTCVSYCAIMLSACAGAFNSALDCGAACARHTDLDDFNITMQAGDTLQCRVYHASVAVNAPDVHCSHAKGAAPCAP
jgi:hypothetical protein